MAADDFDNAKLSYTQAKEQVVSAKEEVQRAQTTLGYATITSPIAGVVIAIAEVAGVEPAALAKRTAIPLSVALVAMIVIHFFV